MKFTTSYLFDPVDLVEKQFRQFQTFRLLGVKFNSNNLLQNNGIPIFCKENQQRGKQLHRNLNTINFMNTCTQLEIQIRQWFLECISEQISIYFPVSKLLVQEQILIPYQIRNQYQKSKQMKGYKEQNEQYGNLAIILQRISQFRAKLPTIANYLGRARFIELNLHLLPTTASRRAILIQITIQSSFSRQLLLY
ncbi:Hypothetical_protein [Hexamita inflata]|uniref:Hypothetical_protein n=1 Tax=Hexamita inflata TaxID=28002 RepID=A0AA86TYW7_9EUKA|nr:Hypothetical protein HINF_LOCUS22680 [Hexamita inflata]